MGQDADCQPSSLITSWPSIKGAAPATATEVTVTFNALQLPLSAAAGLTRTKEPRSFGCLFWDHTLPPSRAADANSCALDRPFSIFPLQMPVTQDKVLLMSNYEVLQLLRQANADFKKNRPKDWKGKKSNLATILYESLKYLEDGPCNIIEKDETVTSMLNELKQFELTKSEKLELINHLPSSLVELQLLIEENEERLTEEQMSTILEVISSKCHQLESPMEEEEAVKEEDETMDGEGN